MDRVLGESGIPQDSEAGRREFENVVEQRRRMADGIDYDSLRGGWYVGSETFRDELLAQMHGRFGEHHYGKERAESAEEKAERIICEHLQKANWTEADLPIHAKAHPVKVELALQLRCQTTMTLKWIAQRLQTGSWRHLNRRLYETRKASNGPG